MSQWGTNGGYGQGYGQQQAQYSSDSQLQVGHLPRQVAWLYVVTFAAVLIPANMYRRGSMATEARQAERSR